MKSTTLRVLIPLLVIAVIAVGFATNAGIGTISAFGWGDISILCPLGALGTMLASKTIIPRAIISLIVAVIAIALLGKAFCAWACPVPVVSKLRGVFSKNPKAADAKREKDAATDSLSAEEKALLKGCESGCSSCRKAAGGIDTRHFVLGGSLLSAAIFGFPVFCLICPIGLTFATILLVFLLFSGGDVTWSVVAVPLLLLAEVVLFRKWCSKICPLSALMSLIGKANKTFLPAIDDGKCLETSKNATCGICASVCEQGIDPRHPEKGASWSECTKCRACVEACPAEAIAMPFLPKKSIEPEPVLLDGKSEEPAISE